MAALAIPFSTRAVLSPGSVPDFEPSDIDWDYDDPDLDIEVSFAVDMDVSVKPDSNDRWVLKIDGIVRQIQTFTWLEVRRFVVRNVEGYEPGSSVSLEYLAAGDDFRSAALEQVTPFIRPNIEEA